MTKRFAMAAILSTVALNAAHAVTASVNFNGAVLSTCLITIGTPGTLVANADFTELSSTGPGGLSGTATILATGTGFELSTGAPAAFTTAPAGGDDNVTFTSSYSANGVTSLTDILGSVTSPLGLGLTPVDVELTAPDAVKVDPTDSNTRKRSIKLSAVRVG